MELDTDNESDFTPQPEPAEPELEEVSAGDELSILDRLHNGLPQVHVVEPDEHVIHDDTHDSDDDYAFIDPDYY